jgi:hypothetical protein
VSWMNDRDSWSWRRAGAIDVYMGYP